MIDNTVPPSRNQPWLAWPLGRRVTIRRRLPEGGYSDIVGELLEASATMVRIHTRKHGDVEVPTTIIAVARLIP